MEKEIEAWEKHWKKQVMKAMFTRWERIKLWFMGVKI